MSREERIFKWSDQYQHKPPLLQPKWIYQTRNQLILLIGTMQSLLTKDRKSIETDHQLQGTQEQSLKALRRILVHYFCKKQNHLLKHVTWFITLSYTKNLLFCGSLSIFYDRRHKAAFQNSRVRVLGFTIFLNHYSFWKTVLSNHHKLL